MVVYRSRKRRINRPYIDIVIFNITLKATKPFLIAFLIYLNPSDLHIGFLGSCFIVNDIYNRYKVCGNIAPLPYKMHKLVLFRGECYIILVCLYSIVFIYSL